MDDLDKRWYTIKLIVITAQFANSITYFAALKYCARLNNNHRVLKVLMCIDVDTRKSFSFSYCLAVSIF